MEQNQPLPQSNMASPTPPVIVPQLINDIPKPSFFTRLFSGRLNRQNYYLGSTFFVLIPLICFIIVIFNILLSPSTFAMPYLDPNNPSVIVTPKVSIISLVTTPSNELWTTLGILFFVISLPFVLSLQIRRLHDLNLSGWWWMVNFGSLLPLYGVFSSGITLTQPGTFFWISETVGLIASCFSLYVSLWPGTKGPNKYGDRP